MGNPTSPDDFEGWYVVRTAAFAEKRVVERLADRGIEAYLPLEKHLIRKARQTHTVEHALLPRYLFAVVKREGDFDAIKSIDGVDHMLRRADGKAIRVEPREVAILHLLELLGEFDYTPERRPDFHYGDAVKISDHLHDGRSATFVKSRGRDRAQVLLAAVIKGGMQLLATVDTRSLELVA